MSVRSAFPDVVVAIDDTDMPGTRGTGRLARQIAEEIDPIGRSLGVTRHQLFEGPGVPKTKRNSAAAIGLATLAAPEEILEVVAPILLRERVAGSDPGVSVLAGRPSVEALRFARRVQTELVTQEEALRVAVEEGVPTLGLAGTRGGLIGALAAAVLRADGNDGRYVGLLGIRDLSGIVTVGEILQESGITAVVDADTGEAVPVDVRLDTGDWIRPRLVGGRPVLMACSHEGAWSNADARPH
jgi:hypothetical protein